MRIIVLIKQVPDTWEERVIDPATRRISREPRHAVLDEISERAVEVALRVKDADPKAVEVIAVTMGPDSASDALRRALAMGADEAVHVVASELAGADLSVTGSVLAETVRGIGFDLLVAGVQSTDGASGMLPATVAAHLGVPALTALDDIQVAADGVAGTRSDADAQLELAAALPAVVSITERAADARFPGVMAVMKAKRKPLRQAGVPEGADVVPRSEVLDAAPTPTRTAGTVIADDGRSGERLAEYLLQAVRG